MNIIQKGFSGSTLKWIAIITMLIDHVGAAILTRILLNYPIAPWGIMNPQQYEIVYNIMSTTRNIGRIAFPIFCFLLVEGFLRTRNVYKYMLRLSIFVVVAEIPFDLAFSARWMDWGYQSVMLTMLIGLVAMWGSSLVEQKYPDKKWLHYIGFGICLAMGMLLAYACKTDYAEKGVLSIMVMYFFRKDRNLQLLAGAASFWWELEAVLAFPLIKLYNGKRGMKMKYFFYLFYPLHLLVIYLFCMWMKMHQIAVV